MNPSDFILWLTGFVDALAGQTPTPAQWATINSKLDSVFNKVTPDRIVGALAPYMATTDGARIIPATRTLDISVQGYAAPYEFITTGAPVSYPSRPYSDTAPTSGNLSIIGRFVSVTC